MSRSRRKTPVTGHTTARSEKKDKRMASGKLRVAYRATLALARGGDVFAPDWRCVGHGGWDFAKDGKQWVDVARYARELGPQVVRKWLAK